MGDLKQFFENLDGKELYEKANREKYKERQETKFTEAGAVEHIKGIRQAILATPAFVYQDILSDPGFHSLFLSCGRDVKTAMTRLGQYFNMKDPVKKQEIEQKYGFERKLIKLGAGGPTTIEANAFTDIFTNMLGNADGVCTGKSHAAVMNLTAAMMNMEFANQMSQISKAAYDKEEAKVLSELTNVEDAVKYGQQIVGTGTGIAEVDEILQSANLNFHDPILRENGTLFNGVIGQLNRLMKSSDPAKVQLIMGVVEKLNDHGRACGMAEKYSQVQDNLGQVIGDLDRPWTEAKQLMAEGEEYRERNR